ncbi:MAG: hypothetical protein AAFR59_17490, partial [Bacteroidota bacterium]
MAIKTISFYFIAILLLCSGWVRAQEGCRLKAEDLAPVIQRYNPFFTNHTWDPSGQIEMAQMGEGRILMIAQDGCKRHHTTFTLFLNAEISPKSLDSWIEEVKSLFFK